MRSRRQKKKKKVLLDYLDTFIFFSPPLGGRPMNSKFYEF